MHENFTDRARRVMQLANEEARQLNHEYVGTEHVLLGLVREQGGMAADLLMSLDIDLTTIRREIEKIVYSGPGPVTASRLPLTPRTKKAAEYAMEEARTLGQNYVGTEHLLLGLFRENEGVAAQVLLNLGLSLKEMRRKVLHLLGTDEPITVGKADEPSVTGRDHLPELARRTAEAFEQLFEQLQKVKEEASRSGDLEEAAYISDEQNRLEKMQVRFLRKWPRP
jgi:ATP-dependent Clp protease ATP-binding subunit ClpC